MKDFSPLVKDPSRTVVTSTGGRWPLPDPQALEDAVDAVFLQWAPGGFDSMTDLANIVTQMGRRVFERAGCAECHSGPALTNNRIVPLARVNTQPARAPALRSTQNAWGEPLGYAFDEQVPLRREPRVVRVPIEHLEEEQVRLAYAFGNSPGGTR